MPKRKGTKILEVDPVSGIFYFINFYIYTQIMYFGTN